MADQIWVSPHKAERDWTAGKAEAERMRHFETQAEARAYAIEVAKNQGLELIVQRRDGTVGEKNTYFTPDHCPPRG